MDYTVSAASLGTSALSTALPKNIKQSAEQFESMLIEQMLRSARSSGEGWMGSEDEANATMSDFAEQQFSQVLAANGGFGIAKIVEGGLQSGAVPKKHS